MSNYPPGVSASDIDRRAGFYKVSCEGCGDLWEAVDLDEDGHCPDCAEERRLNHEYSPEVKGEL